ncbi:hypothetical protein [Sorangium sp. So ce131]|uniref:hypothetical protein n=1 Tax=Sorangium sp. So ce131 TaxID=3133282 RepID=UPI003F5D5856
MSQTVTLTLPDRLYEPVRRIAEATNQPLEAVLLTALQVSLPPIEGLPADIAADLVQLETLDDEALQEVMFERVPAENHEEIEALLQSSREDTPTDADRDRLAALQRAADRVMLRKARAAVLLRFRGHRIPTPAELGQRALLRP